MNSINGKLFYSNVKYLSKIKEMKISQIESQCGVSKGYFAKINRMENPNPSCGLLIQLSKLLDVKIDDLIFKDYKALSKIGAEEKIKDFINKIIGDTISLKITWNRRYIDYNRILPLISVTTSDDMADEQLYYRDSQYQYCNLYEEYFATSISEESRLFIIQYDSDSSNKPITALVLKTNKTEDKIAFFSEGIDESFCKSELETLTKIVKLKSLNLDFNYTTNDVITKYLSSDN